MDNLITAGRMSSLYSGHFLIAEDMALAGNDYDL